MKPDGRGIAGLRCRDPFALGQHLRLVMLVDFPITGIAMVARALRFSLFPKKSLEFESLLVVTLGERYKKTPLVRGFKFAFDPRQPVDCWGGRQEDLAAP